MTGPATPAEVQRRLRAFVVDQGLVVLLGAAAASIALGGGAGATSAWAAGGLAAAVATLGLGILSGVTASSPGRRVAGVRLVEATSGAPVGAARGAARSALLALTGWATAGTGWLLLALSVARDETGGGRGWHDRLCGTHAVMPGSAERVPAPPATGSRTHPADETGVGVVDLTALRAQQPAPVPVPRASNGTSLPERWVVEIDADAHAHAGGRAATGDAGDTGTLRYDVMDRLRWESVEFAVVRGGALAVRALGPDDGLLLVRGGAARTVAPGRVATLLPGDRVCVDGRWASVAGAARPVPSG